MRRCRAVLLVAACLTMLPAADGTAVEMFTFFGDGSRIGLPSLEVPIEAYPGIPLRSDRIRARRRAARGGAAAARPAQAGVPAGVTLREVPASPAAVPGPRPAPIPPEPDDVLPASSR